ncbi:signal peptide peptidase SppA [Desulfatiferula olefinivorans]
MKHLMLACLIVCLAGCFSPQVRLFSDGTDPLREFTVEGKGDDKILIVSIRGMISDQPDQGMLRHRPGLVSEVLAQLKKAESDPDIKALILKVDSPGGTVTASDILYHEIKGFKARRSIPVVVSFMNMGTSGAYYLALPADRIMAHPTAVTGSVGVIYMRPKIHKLMEKIGVGMAVNTSGPSKDLGSPFKAATEEEDRYFQSIIDTLAARFHRLVAEHRKPTDDAMARIRTAAVFLPEEALSLKLIDGIGYLGDTVRAAQELAGIQTARVITYRRDKVADDTLYSSAGAEPPPVSPLTLSIPGLGGLPTGFHYLCPMLSEAP